MKVIVLSVTHSVLHVLNSATSIVFGLLMTSSIFYLSPTLTLLIALLFLLWSS
jgi:hypothetical protein